MNTIVIAGNLGRDAELRQSNDGKPILTMSVAVNGRGKVDGQWQKTTTWYKAVVFGKRAEALGRLELTKGTKVIVSGKLEASLYQKRDGSAGLSLEVVANEIDLLGGGGDRAPQQQQGGQPQWSQASAFSDGAPVPSSDDAGDFEDDIPF